jgi:hypothetical protein
MDFQTLIGFINLSRSFDFLIFDLFSECFINTFKLRNYLPEMNKLISVCCVEFYVVAPCFHLLFYNSFSSVMT